MNRQELIDNIRLKKSFLCVGLDPDTDKIPAHLRDEEDPIYEFNKAIIDATAPFCVAFKPNTAFYEAYGISGLTSLEKTILYIRENYPTQFIIADAKRGDIGNTGEMYARAFFRKLNADAVTVAPYMGADSVKPFLKYEDKWAVILALTSNEGASDFQKLPSEGRPLYMHVLEKCVSWGTSSNTMFVIGATRAEDLKNVRAVATDHFLLIPGVGAQGGSLEEVCRHGLTEDIGLLINASRSIIYASSAENFANAAAREAEKMSVEMARYITASG